MALTSYTSLPNSTVQAGGRPRGSTVTALRDNPIAIAEGDTTAPVNAACWHPYDMVLANDGATGRYYDFATDGAVGSRTSPNFVDGWEYRVRGRGISHNNGGTADLELLLYMETSAAYGNAGVLVTAGAAATLYDFEIELPSVRRVQSFHRCPIGIAASPGGTNNLTLVTAQNVSQSLTTAQKILNARVRFSAGSIDAGQLFLDKRRVYS